VPVPLPNTFPVEPLPTVMTEPPRNTSALVPSAARRCAAPLTVMAPAIEPVAPAPPPAGWTRDFVLIGDGWEKDGDFNTGYSKTVLPLPRHEDPAYTATSFELEQDPAYVRHPDDWQRYHTRFVAPDRYLRGLTGGHR